MTWGSGQCNPPNNLPAPPPPHHHQIFFWSCRILPALTDLKDIIRLLSVYSTRWRRTNWRTFLGFTCSCPISSRNFSSFMWNSLQWWLSDMVHIIKNHVIARLTGVSWDETLSGIYYLSLVSHCHSHLVTVSWLLSAGYCQLITVRCLL